MDSASELGKMWEKLFKVIPRPSVSHNNLYCRTCVLVGNAKILPASGVSNVTQHTPVFGWVLRRGQEQEGPGLPPEFCQLLFSSSG